ncbi:MAG: CoA transferase [Gammaproteobacteria bacterium]|nr:CoA transferase [Gammaproteobacteria bacterium]
MTLPLQDLEVVDIGTLTPGKYCGFLLADLGASVTRVERALDPSSPSVEDRALNLNKRSMLLDLRAQSGRRALKALTRRAAVVIEGARPGVAARNGFDYQSLSALNPSLVYCAISAYGQNGPYRELPGYDLVFMGLSGVWHTLLQGREPPRVPGLFLADAVTGLTAALGIVSALLGRERHGEGAYLDLSMLDSTFALLGTSHGLRHESADGTLHHGPQIEPGRNPAYRLYRCADGRHLVLSAVRPASWTALCELVDEPGLADGPPTDAVARARACERLEQAFARKSLETWLQALHAQDIDAAAYNDVEQAFTDPQLRARDMLWTEDDGDDRLTRIHSPLHISMGRAQQRPAPRIGEHTEQILRELDLE